MPRPCCLDYSLSFHTHLSCAHLHCAPGSPFKSEIQSDPRVHLICHLFSGITVLLPNVYKELFHVFCPSFGCLGQEHMSSLVTLWWPQGEVVFFWLCRSYFFNKFLHILVMFLLIFIELDRLGFCCFHPEHSGGYTCSTKMNTWSISDEAWTTWIRVRLLIPFILNTINTIHIVWN